MLNHARAELTAGATPMFTPGTTRQSQRSVPPQTRLLLVCDSAAGTARLRSALNLGAVEIVSVVHCEELRRVGGQEYALAIVDVTPTKLVDVLKTIRANEGLAELPVFVQAGGISAEAGFAGVLPQYRAMPCGYNELVALARQRLAPAKRPIREGTVL
jgi:hypothetical protein